MSGLYSLNGFSERVNHAARVIVKGGNANRNFDTCFEMGDGGYVATAVYLRSLKNTDIAHFIWKYLDKDHFFNSTWPKTKDIPRSKLKAEAIKNNPYTQTKATQ